MSTPKPKRQRRGWFIAGCIVAGLCGLGSGAFLGLPSLVERAALRVVAKVERRLGLRVTAERVTWTWGGAVHAEGLVVAGADGAELARVRVVDITLAVDVWARRARADKVALSGVTLQVARAADGKTNFDALIAALRAHAEEVIGGGGLVKLEPLVPTIEVSDLTIAADVHWPKLPLHLSLPQRVELLGGRATLAPRTPDRSPRAPLALEAHFTESSLDPGFGFSVQIEGGAEVGPERLGISFARPIRFMLGQRVAGIGGVAWTPAGLELASLQLSVPLAADGAGAGGSVDAAATFEKVTLRPEPLMALVRAALDAGLGGGVGGGASGGRGGAPLAALLGQLDGVDLVRPVIALSFDGAGHHSFEDLLPRGTAGGAGAEGAAGAVGGAEDDGPAGAPEPAPPTLVSAVMTANLSATERLLAPGKARDATPLPARIANKVAGLRDASQALIRRAQRLLGKLFMKSVSITGGALTVALDGSEIAFREIDLDATANAQGRHVKATFHAASEALTGFEGHLEATESADGKALVFALRAKALPIALIAPLARRAHLVGDRGVLEDVDLTLTSASGGERWELTGRVATRGLAFQHPSVARDPLTGLDLGWSGTVRFDAATGQLTVADSRWTSRDVTVTLNLDVAAGLTTPKIHLAAELPATPCQRVFEAIPKEMVPLLDGLDLRGDLAWTLGIDLDTARPSALVIDSKPVLRSFEVASLGHRVDPAALRSSHTYAIRLADGSQGQRFIGPATGSWVALGDITRFLPLALTTTEDGTFYSNDGISTFAMRESLATNIERGGFFRGASTITQQLVKNLYLGGEKTLSRKLQELFIAWQLSRQLSKDEIMALYLNAIEFGPGIYGIGDAAFHYFGKRPSDLTLGEAVFLDSIIPAPRRYYAFFEQGALTPRWREYVTSLIKIMVDRQKLTADEAAEASLDLVFRGHEPETTAPLTGFDAPPENDPAEAPRAPEPHRGRLDDEDP